MNENKTRKFRFGEFSSLHLLPHQYNNYLNRYIYVCIQAFQAHTWPSLALPNPIMDTWSLLPHVDIFLVLLVYKPHWTWYDSQKMMMTVAVCWYRCKVCHIVILWHLWHFSWFLESCQATSHSCFQLVFTYKKRLWSDMCAIIHVTLIFMSTTCSVENCRPASYRHVVDSRENDHTGCRFRKCNIFCYLPMI